QLLCGYLHGLHECLFLKCRPCAEPGGMKPCVGGSASCVKIHILCYSVDQAPSGSICRRKIRSNCFTFEEVDDAVEPGQRLQVLLDAFTDQNRFQQGL